MHNDPSLAEPTSPWHSRCGEVRPAWRRVATAGELFDLSDRVILHAGPPFTDPTRPSPVVLSSAVMAILHAGWATEEAQAERMVREQRVRLEPAQHWGGVLPLAAVVTRDTPVVEVVDMAAPTASARHAWSLLSSGAGAQIRFGSREPALLSRLAWRDQVLMPSLRTRLESDDALALWPMARTALAAGDDLHAQTTHATGTLIQRLVDRTGLPPTVHTTLQQSPLFFLTLWMAACHLMLQAAIEPGTGSTARGGDASGLVLAMAGNGQDFGLRVQGAPRRWFTAPALAPQGMRLGDTAIPLSPMVGDSGVIDAAGFGAQAFAIAPALAKLFAPWRRPANAGAPGIQFDIGHAALAPGSRALAALRFGLDAHAIAATQTPPDIAIAMLAVDGQTGLAGRGVVSTPLAAFAAASAATRPPTPSNS